MQYQELVQEVSQKYAKLREIGSLTYYFCFLMLVAFIALMSYFGIVSNSQKDHFQQNSTTGSGINLTANPASSIVFTAFASATACAKYCQARHQSNQNDCINACFKPDEKATAALPFLHHLHYDYRTALPLLFVPILILSFLFLNRQSAKQSLFRNPNQAIIPIERLEDESDDLVHGICTRTASNPKDMAFGFRSVLSKLLNTKLSAPDYTRGKGDIYKELVTHVLDSTGSLQFLIPASLQRLPPHEAQPSRVPDWSAEFPRYWLKPHLSFQSLRGAASDSRPIWRLDAERKILSVVRSAL
jgi:hypothetical protein